MRALLSVAVVAAALTFASASHAAAGRSSDRATLTIVTVPRLAGVHFALDGKTYATGAQGEVRIDTTHGQHQLRILDTKLHAPGLRSTFVRWGDSKYSPTRTLTIGHNTVLDAGFQQSVLVHFSFADRTGHPIVGRVTRLTLSNTLGGRTSFAPSWPQWLSASSVARRFTGLERTLVQYSIERAMVGGSNVVNHSQQRFYPARTRHVTAHLLLYSARVNVHDFIFGTGAGSQLDLIYPDGTRTSYPLRGRPLVLSSLPRGTYRVSIQADGYVPTVSLALSKNQVLSVKVISYWDMLLFLAVVLGTVSALILIPRPYLRLRLRSVGSGRRPTPDDLEPPKPLSGERKELIHTYMPDRLTRRPAPTGDRQLPAQARRATILATGGRSVRPALRDIPARLFGSIVYRLHRFGEGLPIVSGLRRRQEARSTGPRDFLAGERIELIHVYMGEQIAAEREAAAAAQQAQELDVAPDVAPAGRARRALGLARQRLAVRSRQLLAAVAAAARGFGSMLRRAVAATRTGVRRLVGGLARLRPQITRPAPETGEIPAAEPPGAAPAASKSPAPAAPKVATPAAQENTEPAPRTHRTPARRASAAPLAARAAHARRALGLARQRLAVRSRQLLAAVTAAARRAGRGFAATLRSARIASAAAVHGVGSMLRRAVAAAQTGTRRSVGGLARLRPQITRPAPKTGEAPAARPDGAAPAASMSPAPAIPEVTEPAETPKISPPATPKVKAPEPEVPAPAIPEVVAPPAQEDTEPSPQEKPAPPTRKRRSPASRPSATPTEERTTQAKRKRAAAKRKTTAGRKKRKTTARAKPKTNADAKTQGRTKGKPKTDRASTQPAAQRPARRPRTAAAFETGAPSGSASQRGNGTSNEDLELLRPDLAAAVKALQDDLRDARHMLTEKQTQKKSRRKGSGKARR